MMDSRVLTAQDIKELIPHRYPMLLVDRIIDIVDGISGTGIKNVTINEPFFEGHFPQEPIMPGVLIVEAMAQTAGAIVCATVKLDVPDKSVYFMSIDNARFRKPIVPGDTIHMKVNKIKSHGPVWKFSGQALVNDVLHAEATFTAMIADKKIGK